MAKRRVSIVAGQDDKVYIRPASIVADASADEIVWRNRTTSDVVLLFQQDVVGINGAAVRTAILTSRDGAGHTVELKPLAAADGLYFYKVLVSSSFTFALGHSDAEVIIVP